MPNKTPKGAVMTKNREDANGSQQYIDPADLGWFEANPDRNYRTRNASAAELEKSIFKGAEACDAVVSVLWVPGIPATLRAPLLVTGGLREDLYGSSDERVSRVLFALATGYSGDRWGDDDVDGHMDRVVGNFLQEQRVAQSGAALERKLCLGFSRAGADPDAAMNTLSQNMTRLLRKPSER
jgi:hypothetical protein